MPQLGGARLRIGRGSRTSRTRQQGHGSLAPNPSSADFCNDLFGLTQISFGINLRRFYFGHLNPIFPLGRVLPPLPTIPACRTPWQGGNARQRPIESGPFILEVSSTTCRIGTSQRHERTLFQPSGRLPNSSELRSAIFGISVEICKSSQAYIRACKFVGVANKLPRNMRFWPDSGGLSPTGC